MTADPTTWSDLKARLANWLNRDDLSTTEIPEAIALAERRFQRTILAPEREATTDLAIDAETVALPADLWGIRALHLATDPRAVLADECTSCTTGWIRIFTELDCRHVSAIAVGPAGEPGSRSMDRPDEFGTGVRGRSRLPSEVRLARLAAAYT